MRSAGQGLAFPISGGGEPLSRVTVSLTSPAVALGNYPQRFICHHAASLQGKPEPDMGVFGTSDRADSCGGCIFDVEGAAGDRTCATCIIVLQLSH